MSVLALSQGASAENLAHDFSNPPRESQPWCFWWWLNGNASKEGITRDMEEMRSKGINGAILIEAGGGVDVPRGPGFMSNEWRGLYKHALSEADRCGIVLTLNLCSGWNAGGPWVTHEHAAKKLVSASTDVKGAGHITVALPKPEAVEGFYRDIAVLACPVEDNVNVLSGKLSASSNGHNSSPALAEDGDDGSRWVSNGNKPGMGPTPEKPEYLQFDLAESVPVAGLYLKPYSECGPKDIDVQCSDDGKTFRSLKRVTLKPREAAIISFDETRAKCFRVIFLTAYPSTDGASRNVQVAEMAMLSKDQVASKHLASRWVWKPDQVVDVSRFMDETGRLAWDGPAGTWKILRMGYSLHGAKTQWSAGPAGLEIDPMSAAAMEAHFAETGAKLIEDAGPLTGKTLQYFHIDSWELGQPTWTPQMREEFLKRRGYDPLFWLPAALGQKVDTAAETARFMQDFRRTAADLVAANYYGRLEELSVKGGLRGTHPESGGPYFKHWIDPLECLGRTAVPMGEFWKRNIEPDGEIREHHNPSPKQASSAAHIYGKPICQAEAYTSFADDWIDNPWNMKDIGDAAFCEGITRQVLCFWVHQARLDAKPGFQWVHVGTHFDPNLTWWPMSEGWLTYIARCQHLLRQGFFVADFAYLQSEAIPGFITRPKPQPAVPEGFDYDALNAEVLLTRASAKNNRLTLPDGMSYRYLVLPHQPNALLSPATLKKVNELAEAGVTVIGPKIFAASVPKLREAALNIATAADGLAPDIEFRNASDKSKFVWIHRSVGEAEIYFVSNQAADEAKADCVFRIGGKQPELWDAVTGSMRDLPVYSEEKSRTIVPLQFAPRQSWFVVFRRSGQQSVVSGQPARKNFPVLKPVQELSGAWEVQFDPQWFYPDNGTGGKVRFEKLSDWTQRPEEAIKFYSGIATYKMIFESKIQNPKSKILIDLGQVRDIARVKLNGHDLGVVWTAPWQVEIPARLLKPSSNELEIAAANLWPNRLIGDAALPKEKRHTITNVRTYDTQVMPGGTWGCKSCAERKKTGQPATLLPSGLLGPVQILTMEE